MTPTQQHLATLRDIIRSDAWTSTAYVQAARPGAGEQDLFLRWSPLQTGLAAQGAPAADVTALAEAVLGQPEGDHAICAYAAEGRVVMRVEIGRFDDDDSATFGRWPRTVPLLRWQQKQVPTVAAIVRHGSARAWAYDDSGRLVITDNLTGSNDEIERNAPGGWAQARYQRRAVDSWTHNADEFVARIDELAGSIGARLLLIAGDVREVELVRTRLPASLRDLVAASPALHPVADGSALPADAIRSAIDTAARTQRHEAVVELDDATGRRMAVEGSADVRTALDAGAVRKLVVVHGVADDDLADALVAATLGADGDVVVVESDDVMLVDGVAALLRF